MEIAAVKVDPKERVLVVDDDPGVRSTLSEILETSVEACDVAASAEEALARIAEGAYDLVLTDLQMPGANGLELIDSIRRHDDTIPVILVTAYPTVDLAVGAMKRGAVDFLPKPFDLDMVTHMVGKALQERRLRQENRRLQADVNKAAVIEKLNRELNSHLGELTRLYAISEAMTQFMDSDEVFNQIVGLASSVTGAQRVSLMLFDRHRRHLRIKASVGVPAAVVQRTVVKYGEGVAGKVAETGEPLRASSPEIIHGPALHAPVEPYASRSWLSLPLFVGDHIFGVLNLTDKLDRSAFGEKDEHIVKILLHKAGVKLENQALYEGIYANLLDTLNSLVTTIEAKDPYTREHSHRVTDYALEIAQILGVSEQGREMIEFAGVLHDIGKIGVHDEILTKNGRLTDEEFTAIKQHPLIGEKIVAPLGLNPDERAIIRSHHERLDGRGYPDGLAGEKIPFLARIVCVADAFDAMTTTRSYRRALSVERAVEELRKHRGAQFDPVVVEAALRAIELGLIVPPAFIEAPGENPAAA